MAIRRTTGPCSSQMHSSHHSKQEARKLLGEKKRVVLPITREQCAKHWQRPKRCWEILPPPCHAQALSIHLAHVTHADDTNHGIFLSKTHLELATPSSIDYDMVDSDYLPARAINTTSNRCTRRCPSETQKCVWRRKKWELSAGKEGIYAEIHRFVGPTVCRDFPTTATDCQVRC